MLSKDIKIICSDITKKVNYANLLSMHKRPMYLHIRSGCLVCVLIKNSFLIRQGQVASSLFFIYFLFFILALWETLGKGSLFDFICAGGAQKKVQRAFSA